MSGVVHAGLDALVQGPVVGGELVPQSGVDGRSQSRGHAVVVFPQVGEVGADGEEEVERFVKLRVATVEGDGAGGTGDHSLHLSFTIYKCETAEYF